MTAIMLVWNYMITPLYLGVSRSEVVALLVPAILPFNLIKGGLNATLTLLLYKPLVKALRAANLLPAREEQADAASNPWSLGVMLVAGVVLVTCILLVLTLRGII